MITKKKPISLAEVKQIVTKKSKENEEDEKLKSINSLLKKTVKLKLEKALKLKEDLKTLDIIKLRERDIIKIIDFMPEDAEDIRKIFFGQGVNLSENEINSILETTKKYK